MVLDLIYEQNITTYIHELKHVAQYVKEYNSQGEFTCAYVADVIKHGYALSDKEQQAYKAGVLFFSDFAKRTAEINEIKNATTDQDGIISCIPSNFEDQTYCKKDICDKQAISFINCNMWDSCTVQLLESVGLDPSSNAFTNEELDQLSEEDLVKLISNCYPADNCPSIYNPEQEPSDINFVGKECYLNVKHNFCINYADKTVFLPARDVDGDCRINGLKNQHYTHEQWFTNGSHYQSYIEYDNALSSFNTVVKKISEFKEKQNGFVSFNTMFCQLKNYDIEIVPLSSNETPAETQARYELEIFRGKVAFTFYKMMLNGSGQSFNCDNNSNDFRVLRKIISWDNCFDKKKSSI